MPKIKKHCFCKYAFSIIYLILLLSCRKQSPEPQQHVVVNYSSGNGVYIVNEGNFQFGNSKISYYDFSSSAVITDVFESANNRPLGDVAQSMIEFNNKFYLVVNNSGKIEVVNSLDFKSVATITGFASPRYMLPISNNKAYVSDLYANSISIVDLNSNTIVGSVNCNGWTEEMVMIYGKVFVANQNKNYIYVINTINDQLEDSILVTKGGNSVVLDKYGKIWALCSGDPANNIAGGLYKINPLNNTVENTFSFSLTHNPFKLKINASNDTLYFINGGIYKQPITSSSLPSTPFINKGQHNFYGLGIDPNTNIIYVSDALDYVQQGVVYRYTPNGSLINQFHAAIIPGNFCFN